MEESSSDTDDDVGDIPMPRDTPPPIPRHDRPHRGNANEEPMGEPRIEEDALAAGGAKQEGRVAKPGDRQTLHDTMIRRL